ncbi:TetR/AcrR family transcriptional regulator [Actinomycetospora flava]|uniref:TetR/AcrR family transcriptional regulator n=1 Tax=Actinomycetospora flava TaxID=3129232 RepID=A0ABU8LYL5_9PSEU
MTGGRPAPVSRRDRPAKPPLTRDGIVATAVALVREEGAERLTMRRLAQRLDTGPASLYVYVRDTVDLQAAVLGEFLGAVDLTPVGGPGAWTERVARVVDSYTAVLHAHPSLARVAVVIRPSGPGYLALLDALLALLAEGGMPDDRAAWAVDLLLLVATAAAAEHGTRRAEGAEATSDAHLAASLRGAPADRYPRVAALAGELVSGEGPDRARWFVELLLAGAASTPRP